MSVRSWFKANGFHLTQINHSWTGGLLDRTTKSQVTPYERKVTPDGEVRKKIDTKRKPIPFPKSSASHHVQYGQDNLKKGSADLLDKFNWENTLELESRDLFPGYTKTELEQFKSQMVSVQRSLEDDPSFSLTPDANKSPREARILPGTTMTVLLNVGATLCQRRGMSPNDVGNAIACLRHIDMLSAIANPQGPVASVMPPRDRKPQRLDGQPFNERDRANAWRLAIELECVGETGFNLIKHLMRKPPPPPHTVSVHPTVDRQRDALLHTYLQAAGNKVEEARRREAPGPQFTNRGSLMPDPYSIHSYINYKLTGNRNSEPGRAPDDDVHREGARVGGRVMPAEASWLDKALKAVANHLYQVEEHAVDRDNAGKQITFDRNRGDTRADINPGTCRILDKDCNWWAANMVRNDIGEHSKRYRQHLYRAKKVVKSLKRAMGRAGREAGGPTTGQRMSRWVRQALLPWKGKSAFHAYNSVVPGSPHRLQGGTDASGIADGQAIRQNMIWKLAKTIEQSGGVGEGTGEFTAPLRGNAHFPANHPQFGQPCIADNPESEHALRQMVRFAILNQQCRFNENGDGVVLLMTRHNHGDRLEAPDVNRAKQFLYGLFAGGEQAQNKDTKTRIDALFEAENQQISPERLVVWASQVGAGDGESDPLARKDFEQGQPPRAPEGWNENDWNIFVAGVDRALLGKLEEFADGGKDLAELTQTEAAQLFEDIIKRQKLGHAIEMKDGGYVGVKTQGISYILTRLLSFMTQSVGVDVRYARGKFADIQFGTGTGGRDLFTGTVRAHKTQLGVSYVAGPGHLSKKGDGWSVGLATGTSLTPINAEWADRVGSMFRFRRVYSGVDSDDIGNKQLGRLARKLMDPNNDPGEDEGGAWTNPGDPNDRDDVLKQVLHEFDDVSLSWLKSDENTYKESVSGSGGMAAKLGLWGPFLGVGKALEFTQSTTKWREEGGSLNQQRDIKGTEAKVSLSGITNFIAATVANLNLAAETANGLLDPELWSGVFKVALHDGSVLGTDVYRTGTNRRHTWIYHDGALTYTPGICSFYQKTHKNAADYAISILQKVESLAHDKVKVFEVPRYYHPGDGDLGVKGESERREERARMINQEMTKLLEDLHGVLRNAKSTTEFREYYEWSPKFLQMINDLECAARSEMLKPNWHKESKAIKRVDDFTSDLGALKSLDDAAVKKHGEYRFNITDNVEFKQKDKGPNLPVVNVRNQLFSARRIEMYT